MILSIIIAILCITHSQSSHSELRTIKHFLSARYSINMPKTWILDIGDSELDSSVNTTNMTKTFFRTILNVLGNASTNGAESQNGTLVGFKRTRSSKHILDISPTTTTMTTKHLGTESQKGVLYFQNAGKRIAQKQQNKPNLFPKGKKAITDTKNNSNIVNFFNPPNYFNLNDGINIKMLLKRNLDNNYKKPGKLKPTTIINTDEIQTIPSANEETDNSEILTERKSGEIFTLSESSEEHETKEENNYNSNNENEIHNLNEIAHHDDDISFKSNEEKDRGKRENVVVSYGSTCDYIRQTTCWLERTVGETLTLVVNISSSKDANSFRIHWIRLYHKRNAEKGSVIKIEPERLPWNMVLGSGGRELRLNPVTNTDLDPNAIMAKVFLVLLKKEKEQFQQIRQLDFHIDVPTIDMRNVYFGEELTINIENFLTLPEKGNLLLDWGVEKPFHKLEQLPSNFKVSPSGRSVTIKEFKNEQAGTFYCVLYTSKNIAVAKRKFRILRTAERRHKRSLNLEARQRMPRVHRRRVPYHVCFDDGRRYRDAASFKTMLEYSKPLSRKKRYWQTYTKGVYGRGCKIKRPHRRLHPRWIPFFFQASETTLDPKLMPLEKLIELSENSDGTLDDEIPHEVHFVEPAVTIISDDFMQPNYQRNCSSDSDCGVGALCIIPKGQKRSHQDFKGYCYCKQEYFGDGFVCRKIPRVNHREKRIRRALMDQDSEINSNLFYIDKATDSPIENEFDTSEIKQSSQEAEQLSKAQEYEEEDAMLLSSCVDGKDCSPHATCFSGSNNNRFCKCSSGFRGNGIFCWEILDYVPP